MVNHEFPKLGLGVRFPPPVLEANGFIIRSLTIDVFKICKEYELMVKLFIEKLKALRGEINL